MKDALRIKHVNFIAIACKQNAAVTSLYTRCKTFPSTFCSNNSLRGKLRDTVGDGSITWMYVTTQNAKRQNYNFENYE